MTVLVVGAGATRAEWLSRSDRGAIAPPVARDFLRACFGLTRLSDVRPDFRGRLEQHLGPSDLLGEGTREEYAEYDRRFALPFDPEAFDMKLANLAIARLSKGRRWEPR